MINAEKCVLNKCVKHNTKVQLQCLCNVCSCLQKRSRARLIAIPCFSSRKGLGLSDEGFNCYNSPVVLGIYLPQKASQNKSSTTMTLLRMLQ